MAKAYNVTGSNLHAHGTKESVIRYVNSATFPCYGLHKREIIAWNTAGEDVSSYQMGYMKRKHLNDKIFKS